MNNDHYYNNISPQSINKQAVQVFFLPMFAQYFNNTDLCGGTGVVHPLAAWIVKLPLAIALPRSQTKENRLNSRAI